MYYGKCNEYIYTLIKHFKIHTATWKDERCASMRFIARCYQRLNRFDEARMWLDKAMLEAPHLRDPFVERALLEYTQNNLEEVKKYCLKALEIKEHPKTYINEVFSWDHTVDDLLSICYYYENNMEESLKHVNNALKFLPNDERMLANKALIEDKIKLSN